MELKNLTVAKLIMTSGRQLGEMILAYNALTFDEIPAGRFENPRDRRFLGKKAKQITRELSDALGLIHQLDRMIRAGSTK